MEYQRQVKISVSLEATHSFMKEVVNLPIWTRFFKKCISCNDKIGEMETLIGKSLTSIQEDHVGSLIKLLICSKFAQREEQALVTIEGDYQEANVVFYLKIPFEVSEEQQKKMVLNLEEELRSLKEYLELKNGCS